MEKKKVRETEKVPGETNKTNAAIVAHVKERAPWLIWEFFEKHGKSNIDKAD